MHRTEPTSLQNMALQLAEKLGSLVENNERIFDLKQGVYGGYFNRDKYWLHIFDRVASFRELGGPAAVFTSSLVLIFHVFILYADYLLLAATPQSQPYSVSQLLPQQVSFFTNAL
ncbi:hypothetical protein XENOCAPTIV_028362 [Xenoophorus captivus]|uniref:EIF3CL-like C-terminal domain-containing protein n=1 Tax=Xenoophorus captivus TaxID=1517983 RepID=A0ABV0R711_9TELE